jgi:hypothetical protein
MLLRRRDAPEYFIVFVRVEAAQSHWEPVLLLAIWEDGVEYDPSART